MQRRSRGSVYRPTRRQLTICTATTKTTREDKEAPKWLFLRRDAQKTLLLLALPYFSSSSSSFISRFILNELDKATLTKERGKGESGDNSGDNMNVGEKQLK